MKTGIKKWNNTWKNTGKTKTTDDTDTADLAAATDGADKQLSFLFFFIKLTINKHH